ncbi:putative ribosomally synthesized peptide with SipW-like signal peptide [Microbacterium ginsengiterrae]|uniref:Putative ribosomally synthesized peptide with SipW-like signal peptide n=1 Tax=Microbacterium ginsengiterrae TaxID=546115 RepID=A0A7W9CD69_9MICO|nr:SipW-dependent-type signal peptide-containing protein [Microbacterium ginsengiterrae]MBB5743435.1 putative ribosomally synthesized peptide with SipW-like signal peptide [Microbacterium ginsengiterrae]
MSVHAVSARRRRKALAIIAGGTAVGVAGLVTLAAWNDNEWVFGGAGPDGESGVGTSQFNVVQNAWEGTSAPTTADFADYETEPGDALTFNVDPAGLTPGDTIYAPVALKTDSDSIGGTLTLQPAVPFEDATHVVVDAGDALWDALTYSVRVTTTAATAENCSATGFASAGSPIVDGAGLDDVLDGTSGFVSQTLQADGQDVQYYCFAITLPNDPANQNLQGRTVFPAWRFAASSVTGN